MITAPLAAPDPPETNTPAQGMKNRWDTLSEADRSIIQAPSPLEPALS